METRLRFEHRLPLRAVHVTALILHVTLQKQLVPQPVCRLLRSPVLNHDEAP